MDRGFTLLWRKSWKNHVLYERGKVFSRFEAWLYLVNVMASGVEENGMKRGEFEASIRYLAKAWRWSNGRVERFLTDLQCGPDPMIMLVGQQTGHFARHFIICKYNTYNPKRDGDGYSKRDKVKEVVKEVEINMSQATGAVSVDSLPSVESFQLSEKLRKAIAARDPNSRASRVPDLTVWARDIDKLMRIDHRRAEDIEVIIAWCQGDGCFWGPNILSGRKLRDKFDTMWGQMQRDKKLSPDAPVYDFDETRPR